MAKMAMLAKLPSPGPRDLGPKCKWAQDGDLHPLTMQHLSMVDENAQAEMQAAAAAAARQQQMQMQMQQQAQGPPPDPEWVLGAPQVAMDMRRPAAYWPH